ncbi:MAG: pilus assembly protein TadG-related protein [Sulfitobacter sp.]
MKKLFSTTCIPTFTGYKKSPFLRQFAHGEDGNVTVLSLFFIGILMILSGISWDLNSHEYHRVKIQGTADRAVLAAADLDQTMDPEEVVKDYFDKVGYPDLVSSVTVDEGLNFRTVAVHVDAIVEVNTINGTLNTNAYLGGSALNDANNAAAERIQENRPADAGLSDEDIYAEEQEAAKLFQIAELVAARKAEIQDMMTTGENPEDYAAYEGLTEAEFNQLVHDEELAKALDDAEFVRLRALSEAEERVNNVEISMVLDTSGSMGSNSKMSNLQNAARTFVDTVITDATEDLVSLSIIPYAEHVSAGPDLMSKFNVDVNNPYSHCIEFAESDFDTAAMTSTEYFDQVQHMAWGYTSYNNMSSPVCPTGQHDDITAFSQNVSALKSQISGLQAGGSTSIFAGMKWAAGLLDPAFQPINSDLADDGVTDPAFDARPAAYDDHETLKTVILMTDGQNHYSYRVNDNYYANSSHAAHWNKYNLDWYLNRYVRSYQHSQFKYLKYWPDYGDTLLDSICTAAKDNNIVIWSIGFEVTDHSADVMESCASSPSHFFRVEGVEIKDAFKAIARQINQLRLTQ